MLGFRFDLNDAMEKEVADEAVRGGASGAATRGPNETWSFRCPVCEQPMRVCSERDLNEFGGLDVKLHKLECDCCGMLTGRVFHPSIGYDSHLVR